MSVATLYDIHANLAALEAVLAEVRQDARIALGGDHVSGPFPVGTLERGPASLGFPRPRPTPGRAEATALLEADAIGA